MPDIDVSDVLLDPLFTEELTVVRSAQSISDRGRGEIVETILNPYGTVQQPSSDPNIREEDYEHNKQNITVHAYNFIFRGPSEGGTADQIRWHGNTYVVRRVHDFSSYGVGYTAVDCEVNTLLTDA